MSKEEDGGSGPAPPVEAQGEHADEGGGAEGSAGLAPSPPEQPTAVNSATREELVRKYV